jgi:hypothetical protein
MDRDLYAVLGVPRTASEEQIRHAFWALAKKYHPDVCGDDPDAARKFIEVGNAAETLLDPTRRASYDASFPAVTPAAARPATSYAAYAASWAASHPAPTQPPPPAPPPSTAPPPGGWPPTAPPPAPPASPAPDEGTLAAAFRIISVLALVALGIVGVIFGVTHPSKDNSNPADVPLHNGSVDWKAAGFSLDDGWGINLGGGGAPRIQIVPGTTADLMVADGYLSTDGQLSVLLPPDTATYQHCVAAVGQSGSQSESLSDLTPDAGEAVCVHGGGGELASIQVTRDDGSNLTFNITVWEYL